MYDPIYAPILDSFVYINALTAREKRIGKFKINEFIHCSTARRHHTFLAHEINLIELFILLVLVVVFCVVVAQRTLNPSRSQIRYTSHKLPVPIACVSRYFEWVFGIFFFFFFRSVSVWCRVHRMQTELLMKIVLRRYSRRKWKWTNYSRQWLSAIGPEPTIEWMYVYALRCTW